MSKKKLIVVSSLALSLAITACGNDQKIEDPDVNTPSEESSKNLESPVVSKKKYEDIKITASEAYNIFLESKADSKVEKIALDHDNNAYYYKIKGYDQKNEYELKIDAVTGKVVKEEKELNDKMKSEITVSDLEKAEKLIKETIEDYSGEIVKLEWELDVENDKKVLEVEIEGNNGDMDYVYDVETGELLKKDR